MGDHLRGEGVPHRLSLRGPAGRNGGTGPARPLHRLPCPALQYLAGDLHGRLVRSLRSASLEAVPPDRATARRAHWPLRAADVTVPHSAGARAAASGYEADVVPRPQVSVRLGDGPAARLLGGPSRDARAASDRCGDNAGGWRGGGRRAVTSSRRARRRAAVAARGNPPDGARGAFGEMASRSGGSLPNAPARALAVVGSRTGCAPEPALVAAAERGQELVEVVLRVVAEPGGGLADVVPVVNERRRETVFRQEVRGSGKIPLQNGLRIGHEIRPVLVDERLLALDEK